MIYQKLNIIAKIGISFLLVVLLVALTGCSGKGDLSRGKAKKIIYEKIKNEKQKLIREYIDTYNNGKFQILGTNLAGVIDKHRKLEREGFLKIVPASDDDRCYGCLYAEFTDKAKPYLEETYVKQFGGGTTKAIIATCAELDRIEVTGIINESGDRRADFIIYYKPTPFGVLAGNLEKPGAASFVLYDDGLRIEDIQVQWESISKTDEWLEKEKALWDGQKYTEPAKAIEYLDQALKLDANNPEMLNKKGTAYFNMGQFQRTIEMTSEAIRLMPNYFLAYNNRGNAYANLREFQKAIDDYSRVIQLKPDFADAYNNRGVAYLLQGNKELGCSDVKKACEIDLGKCSVSQDAQSKGYCK